MQDENSQNTNNNKPVTVVTVEQKEIEYPEIDIRDIETYTVSKELSKKENDGHWVFRSKERDHQKEIQDYLQRCNNQVLEVLNSTENQQIIYNAKRWLQSFKKRYYKNYIARLTNKANSPSWITTGRAGRNTRKDNKMNNRYDNLMRECCQLQDEFKDKISSTKYKIKREKQAAAKEKLKALKSNIDITNIKFKRTKTDNINGIKLDYTCTVYKYNNYYIASNYWSKFRVYNSIGKELTSCNSLEDAKITLIALLSQEQEQKAI